MSKAKPSYFKHYHDESARPNVVLFIAHPDIGVAGYGRWNILRELMGLSEYGFIDLRVPGMKQLVAESLRIDVSELPTFIDHLVEFGLIDRGAYVNKGYIANETYLAEREYAVSCIENGARGGAEKAKNGRARMDRGEG